MTFVEGQKILRTTSRHGGLTLVNAPAVDASAARDATYTRCTQSTSTAARTSTTPVFSFGTSSMASAYASRTVANERSEDCPKEASEFESF